MTREEAYKIFYIHKIEIMNEYFQEEHHFQMSVDKIYDDFDSRTCKNCKHKDGEIVSSIHCAYFEQYLPVEIGKCDKWESRDGKI